MAVKVLVMGLPGSGKTTLSRELVRLLPHAQHLNADMVRGDVGDWDFSPEGRVRQAQRMARLADASGALVVADFVCPTEATRAAFAPDVVVYMATVRDSRYPDTDAMFEPPRYADAVIHRHVRGNAAAVAELVQQLRPQGVMIGRYQPFHDGHKALFLEVLARAGFVNIQVRTMPVGPNNPHSFIHVAGRIDDALRDYRGHYRITRAPNVSGVYYGRDVGYTVERISLSPQLEAIRATDIRAAGD